MTATIPGYEAAAVSMAEHLEAQVDGSRPLTVTWLNHSSAPIAISRARSNLGRIDLIGIDGKLLQLLLGAKHRTSADLVVPHLLRIRPGSRVAIIGGSPETLRSAAQSLTSLPGGATVVVAIDGYDGLADLETVKRKVVEAAPDIVMLGLGAGLQEEVALSLSESMNRGVILTCGGFLDQVQSTSYYPSWAYPLRLNWLVRLAREPRRLYRRYTVDAARALADRRDLVNVLRDLPGYAAAANLHLASTPDRVPPVPA